MIAERQAARNAALAKAGRGRAKMGGGEEDIDPMDPVRIRESMGWTLTLAYQRDLFIDCSVLYGPLASDCISSSLLLEPHYALRQTPAMLHTLSFQPLQRTSVPSSTCYHVAHQLGCGCAGS
jgi:hypothetical protein